MQTSNAAPRCPYCGSFPHQGICPSVKAIEYHADGTVKRVEFKAANDYLPLSGSGPSPVTCTTTTLSTRQPTDQEYQRMGMIEFMGGDADNEEAA